MDANFQENNSSDLPLFYTTVVVNEIQLSKYNPTAGFKKEKLHDVCMRVKTNADGSCMALYI